MATKKPAPPAKKKSPGFGAMLLDGVGWAIGEIALPVPDTLINAMKKKKKTTKK